MAYIPQITHYFEGVPGIGSKTPDTSEVLLSFSYLFSYLHENILRDDTEYILGSIDGVLSPESVDKVLDFFKNYPSTGVFANETTLLTSEESLNLCIAFEEVSLKLRNDVMQYVEKTISKQEFLNALSTWRDSITPYLDARFNGFNVVVQDALKFYKTTKERQEMEAFHLLRKGVVDLYMQLDSFIDDILEMDEAYLSDEDDASLLEDLMKDIESLNEDELLFEEGKSKDHTHVQTRRTSNRKHKEPPMKQKKTPTMKKGKVIPKKMAKSPHTKNVIASPKKSVPTAQIPFKTGLEPKYMYTFGLSRELKPLEFVEMIKSSYSIPSNCAFNAFLHGDTFAMCIKNTSNTISIMLENKILHIPCFVPGKMGKFVLAFKEDAFISACQIAHLITLYQIFESSDYGEWSRYELLVNFFSLIMPLERALWEVFYGYYLPEENQTFPQSQFSDIQGISNALLNDSHFFECLLNYYKIIQPKEQNAFTKDDFGDCTPSEETKILYAERYETPRIPSLKMLLPKSTARYNPSSSVHITNES